MLAFIRGSDSFMGTGQIYVKMLSGGEPVQLTNDSRTKLAPTFSPDGSSIAYSVTEPWDTWEVPVLGGEPHLLVPNSSSLTWIEQGKRLLFSEFREGIHLVVVTTDEDRGNSRDVYVPAGKRSMAHHSYLSPDGRWVLIVEMDSQSKILPCRVVPFPAAGVAAHKRGQTGWPSPSHMHRGRVVAGRQMDLPHRQRGAWRDRACRLAVRVPVLTFGGSAFRTESPSK